MPHFCVAIGNLPAVEQLKAQVRNSNETPTQQPAPEAASNEEARRIREEIDALMALPPRGMPDIIVVGDDAVSAIYLPDKLN